MNGGRVINMELDKAKKYKKKEEGRKWYPIFGPKNE
jgi:hypothetical protein